MKYGIITFHNTLNCGASLQAYALCKYLRDKNYDCDIIDYQCDEIVRRELAFRRSANILKSVYNRMLVWPRQLKMIKLYRQLYERENMLSTIQYSKNNIREANKRYDVFITGSDQVWNTNITGGDLTFFLDFTDEKKTRIAFAPSVCEEWTDEEKNTISRLINRYLYLSLREDVGIEYVKKIIKKDITHVCDPTMLLSAEDWSKIAVLPKEKDYILLYLPKTGADKLAKTYSEKTGKKVIWVGTGRVSVNPSGPIAVTPQEWLGYIVNSSVVFTDSYHGLLFAIYFNKPVWTAYNGNRGSRQKSLYNILKIEDSVCVADTNHLSIIDYRKCNERITEFREASELFLENAFQ